MIIFNYTSLIPVYSHRTSVDDRRAASTRSVITLRFQTFRESFWIYLDFMKCALTFIHVAGTNWISEKDSDDAACRHGNLDLTWGGEGERERSWQQFIYKTRDSQNPALVQLLAPF